MDNTMNIRGFAFCLFVLPITALHSGTIYRHAKRLHTSLFGERRERTPTTEDRRWQVKPIGIIESPYLEKFGTPKQVSQPFYTGGVLFPNECCIR